VGRNDRVPIVHHGRPALDLEYCTMTATANINRREAWFFDRDPSDVMRGIWLWSDTNTPIELKS